MTSLSWDMTNRVLQEQREFPPDPDSAAGSNIGRYMASKGFSDPGELYRWSIENPEEFWAEQAESFQWSRKWDTIREWNEPYAKWFVGGRLNLVESCLDRHMGTPVEHKIAYQWIGEGGETSSVTYRELYERVCRFANGLKRLGLGKGDFVTIYMPRVVEQIVAMMACARIGAVHSIIYSGFSSQAIVDRIQDQRAKAVITTDGYLFRGKLVDLKAIVDRAVAGCPTVEHVVVSQRAQNRVEMAEGRDLWWEDVVDGASTDCPAEQMDAEDMLYVLYTSGTTGKPKGVVHVHGGYLVGAAVTAKYVLDLKDDDVFWCTADPGWVTGHSYIVYGILANGATSVFYEGAPDFPDAGRFWEIIEKYKVSIWYTTPTAIRAMMKWGDRWPEAHDRSSLRLLGTVGEPINPEAWIWYRRLAGADRLQIVDTWWQTETGAHLITPTPLTVLKPGSATLPFLGIEADVVDKDGHAVPVDKGGFLVIRQPWPSMMRTVLHDDARYQSYWNTIPHLYFAGDAAYKDEDGYLWIQGRVDDVIKKSGYRLGSAEIESSLVSHQAVAEAAVIGKPHELTGESIKGFVILKQGVPVDDGLVADLRRHVRTELGPIAVPEEIEIVESLPKTRSGKIMRRVIKARELGLDVGDLSTLED